MTWQAAAAWVGAVLGIINFIGALAAKRPAFTLRPCRDRAGASGPPALITVSSTSRPVHLRSLRLWPKRQETDRVWIEGAEDRAGVASIVNWHVSGGFSFFIEAGQPCSVRIEVLNTHAWRWVIIRWSDDSRWQPFPWHVRLLQRGQVDALNEALATDAPGRP
jgi:hypothetical protein